VDWYLLRLGWLSGGFLPFTLSVDAISGLLIAIKSDILDDVGVGVVRII